MKRTNLLIIVLLLAGAAVFAQSPDMSFYIDEYNRQDATLSDMLNVLQMVQSENLSGIGGFYQNAINVFIQRLPNFATNQERIMVEEASRLIIRGLAAEQQTDSAAQVWLLLQYFDIANQQNDGLLMYEALVAMGQINATFYTSHIAGFLESFNARPTTDALLKSKIQRVVPGVITALEILKEPAGVKPVFFASIGWYDNSVKAIASASLNRLMESLGEVIPDIIIGILRDPLNTASVKNSAWQEFIKIHVSDESKARVAAVALEQSYVATSRESAVLLRTMRLSSIDTIRQFGVSDGDIVYPYIERTYRESYDTVTADFEMIIMIVRALTAARTDEAVDLLTQFLTGVHNKRRSGPWGATERDLMRVFIQAIASTGTQSTDALRILRMIAGLQNTYTPAEQQWAKDALSALNAL
ncbi:MAG: hypothetical protein FWC17_00935 [Treponema sp.]|nr:hypothetical protein [Treponema sp.]